MPEWITLKSRDVIEVPVQSASNSDFLRLIFWSAPCWHFAGLAHRLVSLFPVHFVQTLGFFFFFFGHRCLASVLFLQVANENSAFWNLWQSLQCNSLRKPGLEKGACRGRRDYVPHSLISLSKLQFLWISFLREEMGQRNEGYLSIYS